MPDPPRSLLLLQAAALAQRMLEAVAEEGGTSSHPEELRQGQQQVARLLASIAGISAQGLQALVDNAKVRSKQFRQQIPLQGRLG